MFGMGVAYGLLRLPKMPEVKEWRDRARKQKENHQADEEVQSAGDIDWTDREVDVSHSKVVFCKVLLMLIRSFAVGQLCLPRQSSRGSSTAGDGDRH
jgi:hypothetical protein